jgi:hypothetical protein
MNKTETNCPECKSNNLEYLPNVDGNSWVNTVFVQKDGKWSPQVQYKNDENKWVNIETINISKIFYNDGRPFFVCNGCTAEFDSSYL